MVCLVDDYSHAAALVARGSIKSCLFGSLLYKHRIVRYNYWFRLGPRHTPASRVRAPRLDAVSRCMQHVKREYILVFYYIF
jgi:hypothetical protein